MLIDTSFDFRTDASGRDPDGYSVTLCRYHKLLWSRVLPSGALFNLEVSRLHGKFALRHRSEFGEFFLTSDSITHTYTRWSSLKHITGLFSEEENEAFRTLGYTIGGMLVFPGKIIDRKPTINGARGLHGQIKDRFDLTLECIRRHYLGLHSPLEDTLKRYGDFFALFEDFRGYVEFFMLQDLVVDDYSAVMFLMPFDDFRTSPVPGDIGAYREYRRLTIKFLEARNRRIDRYTASSHVFGASSDHSLFNSILGDHEEQRIPQKLARAFEEMPEPKPIPEQEPRKWAFAESTEKRLGQVYEGLPRSNPPPSCGTEETMVNEYAPSTAWTYAEWTAPRLKQAKQIAADYPAITLILTLTSAGKKVTAAEVRQALNISNGKLLGQLGAFTRRIVKEIAPEWAAAHPPQWGYAGGEHHKGTSETVPGWHWPFAADNTARGSGSLIYYMPEQVRPIWLSI